MASTHYTSSSEEIAQKGEDIYNRLLRTRLEAECRGKIVAIDVDSGDHAVAESVLDASRQISAKHPQAQIFLLRVGEKFLRRFGTWKKSDPA
jgi:hypothetical protein